MADMILCSINTVHGNPVRLSVCLQTDTERTSAPDGGSRGVRPAADPRAAVLRPADWLPMLLSVYGAAAGTAVRHVCLQATLRCVSAAEPDTLKVGDEPATGNGRCGPGLETTP